MFFAKKGIQKRVLFLLAFAGPTDEVEIWDHAGTRELVSGPASLNRFPNDLPQRAVDAGKELQWMRKTPSQKVERCRVVSRDPQDGRGQDFDAQDAAEKWVYVRQKNIGKLSSFGLHFVSDALI